MARIVPKKIIRQRISVHFLSVTIPVLICDLDLMLKPFISSRYLFYFLSPLFLGRDTSFNGYYIIFLI